MSLHTYAHVRLGLSMFRLLFDRGKIKSLMCAYIIYTYNYNITYVHSYIYYNITNVHTKQYNLM